MKLMDVTLPTPPENLACDEALLDWCEEEGCEEILRFWEPGTHFVVLGYANHAGTEVNLSACAAKQIPVLRRCTGGGTVVQGPGCLNYSLLLRFDTSGPLRSISTTNDFVLKRHSAALTPLLGAPVELRGHTDLTIAGEKFSGNSQRRRKTHLLFHGTFLLQFDISLIETFLPMPSRQPDYRHGRAHSAFLRNINVPVHAVKRALQNAWDAVTPESLPMKNVEKLAREKYASDDWNFRFR